MYLQLIKEKKGFYNVAKQLYDCSYNLKDFKRISIPGAIVNNAYENKINIKNCDENLHIGKNIGTLEDLNDIPSHLPHRNAR